MSSLVNAFASTIHERLVMPTTQASGAVRLCDYGGSTLMSGVGGTFQVNERKKYEMS